MKKMAKYIFSQKKWNSQVWIFLNVNCSLLQKMELSKLICNTTLQSRSKTPPFMILTKYTRITSISTHFCSSYLHLLEEMKWHLRDGRKKEKDVIITLNTLKNRLDLTWSIIQIAIRHPPILACTKEWLPLPYSFSLGTEWLRFNLLGYCFCPFLSLLGAKLAPLTWGLTSQLN